MNLFLMAAVSVFVFSASIAVGWALVEFIRDEVLPLITGHP